jgi:hypothetical protein
LAWHRNLKYYNGCPMKFLSFKHKVFLLFAALPPLNVVFSVDACWLDVRSFLMLLYILFEYGCYYSLNIPCLLLFTTLTMFHTAHETFSIYDL